LKRICFSRKMEQMGCRLERQSSCYERIRSSITSVDLSLFHQNRPVHISMPLHFVRMGAENKAGPPEVVVWFPIPAYMDTAESISLTPANQFVERIGQDLAHGCPFFQVEPGTIPGNRLRKKVDHALDSQDIRVNKVIPRNGARASRPPQDTPS
jgi:hypothetical protein